MAKTPKTEMRRPLLEDKTTTDHSEQYLTQGDRLKQEFSYIQLQTILKVGTFF